MVAVGHFINFPILSFGNYDGAGINFYYVLIGILIPSLFYFLQLRTEVNEQGFFYQFFPIHFSYHKISFEEIESVEAIDYKPIKDYGGWELSLASKQNHILQAVIKVSC